MLAVGPGIGATPRDRGVRADRRQQISIALGSGCGRPERLCRPYGIFSPGRPARRCNGLHPSPRRDGAPDREDDGGDSSPACGCGARVLAKIWRHPGAEGISNPDCLARRTGGGQSHGQSRNGQGRNRRCADGFDGGVPGAISCLIRWAKLPRLRYTCMDWQATSPRKNWDSIPCWPGIFWKRSRRPTRN